MQGKVLEHGRTGGSGTAGQHVPPCCLEDFSQGIFFLLPSQPGLSVTCKLGGTPNLGLQQHVCLFREGCKTGKSCWGLPAEGTRSCLEVISPRKVVFGFSWVENAGLRWELNGKQPRSAPNLLIIAVLQRKKGLSPAQPLQRGWARRLGVWLQFGSLLLGVQKGMPSLLPFRLNIGVGLSFPQNLELNPAANQVNIQLFVFFSGCELQPYLVWLCKRRIAEIRAVRSVVGALRTPHSTLLRLSWRDFQ